MGRPDRSTVEAKWSVLRRITLGTRSAHQHRQSTAPGLKFSILKPSYGGPGRAKSANYLRSPAIPSEWPLGSTTTARSSACRVRARTP